jgi:hypothetical protein
VGCLPACSAWWGGCRRGGRVSERLSGARESRQPRRFANGGGQQPVEDSMHGYALLHIFFLLRNGTAG